MVRAIVTLYLSLLQPAPERVASEPVDAMECAFTGGCCTCQTLASGMQACNQCEGTTAGAGACESGETYVPCAPGMCWSNHGKVNVYVTGGNSGCH